MRFLFFLGCLYLGVNGCLDVSRIPGVWKTYEHPTFRFSVKLPRTWEAQQDGPLGTAFVFRAPEASSFKPNIAVVAAPLREKLTLDQLTDRSEQQLKLLFNQYVPIGRANTQLGLLEARELRGRYVLKDEIRIVRNVIAVASGTQYVLTFSSLQEREKDYLSIFDGVRKSFSTL